MVVGLFSATTTSLALVLSLTDGGKEVEKGARGDEEGPGGGAEGSVANDDASAGWIPVVCLMAVTKEEVGRRPTVERGVNPSADPCWHQNVDSSVKTMSGVLNK